MYIIFSLKKIQTKTEYLTKAQEELDRIVEDYCQHTNLLCQPNTCNIAVTINSFSLQANGV